MVAGANQIATSESSADQLSGRLSLSYQSKSFPIDYHVDLAQGLVFMSNRWLSVEEITEHLGVSKDSIYAWIAKRKMPAHKVGRLWKFQQAEVDAWVRTGGANEDAVQGRNEV